MDVILDPSHLVRIYYKKFDHHIISVFRVVATETNLPPPGHIKVRPAHILNWNRPSVTLNADINQQNKFSTKSDSFAPNILFNCSDEVIPIALGNRVDSHLIIRRITERLDSANEEY